MEEEIKMKAVFKNVPDHLYYIRCCNACKIMNCGAARHGAHNQACSCHSHDFQSYTGLLLVALKVHNINRHQHEALAAARHRISQTSSARRHRHKKWPATFYVHFVYNAILLPQKSDSAIFYRLFRSGVPNLGYM